MRILQINLCRDVGGSSVHHADLSIGLRALGHDVLVADRLGTFTYEYTGGTVDHSDVPKFRTRSTLTRLVREFRPDVIHTHQSLASRLANRIKGPVPVVSTIHGAYKERSYGKSDGIICVADHQRRGMGLYRGRSVTISNWLSAGNRQEATASDIRHELKVDEAAFLFGFVGRIHKAKGVLDLIEAFRAVQSPTARLVIVGDGKHLAAARKSTAGDPRIHFTGHRQDAASLMRAFDVFVFPSHAEVLPLVLIEAMAAGCRIISTNTDGAVELLAEQDAKLVPRTDPAALTAALNEELERRDTASHSRHKYDLSRFDRDRQIRKIVDFYGEVTSVT